MVKLTSMDGHQFDVELEVLTHSKTLMNMLEEVGHCGLIPVPNVDSKVLSKVIDYCKAHTNTDETNETETSTFDTDFVDVELHALFELVLAANYLDIPPLQALITEKLASMIREKNTQEIRELFGVTNDFTAEEEEHVRSTLGWAMMD